MAGTDPRFPSAKVRAGLKFAMQMAFPEDSAQQITWQWTIKRDFKKQDSGGFPFEWTSSQVQSQTVITDKIVDCAVQTKAPAGTTRVGGTTMGIMDIASATVTLLDVDYDALVAHGLGDFPDQAVMDGAVYVVQTKGPPEGLFDVTVYSIYLQAIDES